MGRDFLERVLLVRRRHYPPVHYPIAAGTGSGVTTLSSGNLTT